MATLISGLGGAAGYGENSFRTASYTGNLDDGSTSVDLSSVFPAAPKSQHTINTEADQVITIPITVAADGELGHLSWDDLLGKR